MKNTKASSSTALPRAEALRNPILNIDSYKLSHYLQYPPAARAVSAYVEARSGEDMDHVLFFWLQMFVLNCVSRPVTASGIDEAEDLATAHGLPFNRGGWKRILEKNAGFLPIEIEALAEGSIVPTSISLVQIRSTDPQLFWLATYIETALLRAIWYPSTVATS